MRLTDLRVQSFKPPERGQQIHRCSELKGFACRVSQGGTKTFVLIVGLERQFITVGRYPAVTLAEARAVAKNILAERQLGRYQPPREIFGPTLDLYDQQHVAKLAPRTQQEQRRLWKRYLTHLRPKKLADITTKSITDITDKAAPSEAEHLHRACTAFFRWCVRRRLLQHSPLEGLELPHKSKPRERVLSDDELRAVWHAADKYDGYFGVILKLLILTGQRRGEIAALQRDWISFTPSNICIPSSHTKNGKAHTFPVGTYAASLVSAAMAITSDLLFPARWKNTPFNGFSKSKEQLDKLAQIEPWTLHDLRRTYATNLQRLGIRLEVIEALLNHISGTRAGVAGIYQRHHWWDEMVEAVHIYEKWVLQLVGQRYSEAKLWRNA